MIRRMHGGSRKSGSESHAAAHSESNPSRKRPTAAGRAAVLGAWLAAALIAVGGLAVACDRAVSLPALCGACHEIGDEVDAWAQSPHAEVGCDWCHGDPSPVLLKPSAFLDRASRLAHDTYAHVTGRFAKPVAAGSIPDSACGRCHQPGRTATRDGLLIDHAAHEKRNVTCVSCHRRTAHPGVLRERGQAMMTECFRCHGLARTAKASGRCDACHPKDFDLVPAAHREESWLRGGHGRAAAKDRAVCSMCHVSGFCRDCHGLEMPHADADPEWSGSAHVRAGTRDRRLCERCHEGGSDLCSTCHHRGPAGGEASGPWVTRHFLAVRARGAAECFDCHSYGYCSYCHVNGEKSPAGS